MRDEPQNNSTMNNGKSKSNSQGKQRPKPVTVEKVRMIMEEEGRAARNLVSWSIPIDDAAPHRGKKSKKRENPAMEKRARSCENTRQDNLNMKRDNRTGDHTHPPIRSRSNSRRPVSIRARYWAYLFENLRRAVDEIYVTCEVDSSVVECKEVLLIIDNYRHEFQALIDWINLQERLENAGDHNRPTSLAWEVRKSSPGRPRQKLAPRGPQPGTKEGDFPGSKINRCLTYAVARCNPPERHGQNLPKSLNNDSATWADRVKGVSKPKPQLNGDALVNGKSDESGWETVPPRNRQQRHKHTISPVEGNPPNKEPTSYVNVVVDQLIGNTGSDAVVFSNNWSSDKTDVGKILFQGDEDVKEEKSHDHGQSKQPKEMSTNAEPKNEPRKNDTLDTSSLEQLHQEEESLARTLCEEHSASIAAAEETERDLMRQLREVEEVEEDTDCDSARSSAGAKELQSVEKSVKKPMEWSEFMAKFEVDEGGMNWGEMVEEEELRVPGRAVQMHEKLSSPSRRRTPAESKRRLEEKHRRAEERRLQMNQLKTQRIHELSEKVQEVVSWKNDLIRRQKVLLQSSHMEKLQRAEEQRAMQLLCIVRKAQAEDTKVSEIAFINELQEQNKRHEVLMRIGEHEDRLQELEDERNKMIEVKSAKEENVKERRRALEKERLDRMEELRVRRQEQDARIVQQKMDKEKEREKLARDKARERQQRLSALNAAQQEAMSELQKKIQLKHDESERRHQEQLEQRKGKAQELSLGKFSTSVTTPHTCNEKDGTNDAANEVVQIETAEIDEPVMSSPRQSDDTTHPSKEEMQKLEERRKMMKKRAKKIRTRMATRSKEFLKRMENKKEQPNSKNKIGRLLKDITRLLTNQQASSGPWPTNRVAALDRALGEINRTLEKQNPLDQSAFRTNSGFEILEEIFQILLKDSNCDVTAVLPDKSISAAALCFHQATVNCHDNCIHALYSNRMTSLVDLLMVHVTNLEPGIARTSVKIDSLFGCLPPSLLRALASALGGLVKYPVLNSSKNSFLRSISSNGEDRKILEAYFNRGLDVISYIVSCGLLDSLSEYLSIIRHEVAPGSNMAAFIENGLAFLESVTSFVTMRNKTSPESQVTGKPRKNRDSSTGRWEGDPTQLLPTLQHTELMGIISVLYGLLLHGAPERPTVVRSSVEEPRKIANHALSVAGAVLKVLNAVAQMDLTLLQASLGAKGVSLEYRHICTYLLWYCVHYNHTCLLHEVIVCVGYFTIGNRNNQDIVNSGAQPTILQQLCLLPFPYFSNRGLMSILFPSLIACCHDNRENLETLEQEASGELLAVYIESEIEERRSNDVVTKQQGDNAIPDLILPTEFLLSSMTYFKCDVNKNRDVRKDEVVTASDVTS